MTGWRRRSLTFSLMALASRTPWRAVEPLATMEGRSRLETCHHFTASSHSNANWMTPGVRESAMSNVANS
jgi:hypothetical protein